MCFTCEHWQDKPMKAETDIVCYKILAVGDEGELYAHFYKKAYKLNKKYRLWKMGDYKIPSKYASFGIKKEVAEGFHAFTSLQYVFHYKDPLIRMMTSYLETVIAEAIIPKGAKYYWNRINGTCVSNKIIITGIFNNDIITG